MSDIQVGVVMGSSSDWDTMQHAVQILADFGIAHEARVVSATACPTTCSPTPKALPAVA
jgi:5-(carboxyamino)imidazole ribonucleotide mutase